MTEDPLVPRPAATVMLVRDTRDGIKVFLMRRHRQMDFVAGVMVFPGGGVDDRDRNADIAWHGPDKDWWAGRLGVDAELAEALVCAAARETFEESGCCSPGPPTTGLHRRRRVDLRESRWPRTARCRSGTFSPENLVLRADLLRPWANWVTQESAPALRHLLLRWALPGGSAPTATTPKPTVPMDHARGSARGLRGVTDVPAAADVDAAGLTGPGALSPKCLP